MSANGLGWRRYLVRLHRRSEVRRPRRRVALILVWAASRRLCQAPRHRQAQQQLHTFYFWFNIVFVVLVTAIGRSFVEFVETLIAQPLSMFELFGSKMPTATHFYMNYLVLQWVSHSMNMMRYINMFKYFAFRKIFDEETARSMSEPEDQDFYGIGSRSTRWTTNLVISIVFSSISPLIALLGFVNFFICRALYGYLIPCAETRKPDLGGAFWVQKLRHCTCLGPAPGISHDFWSAGGRSSRLGHRRPIFPLGITAYLGLRPS